MVITIFIGGILLLMFSVLRALVIMTPEEKRQEDEEQIEFLRKCRKDNLKEKDLD